jgi:hypothetical protein
MLATLGSTAALRSPQVTPRQPGRAARRHGRQHHHTRLHRRLCVMGGLHRNVASVISARKEWPSGCRSVSHHQLARSAEPMVTPAKVCIGKRNEETSAVPSTVVGSDDLDTGSLRRRGPASRRTRSPPVARRGDEVGVRRGGRRRARVPEVRSSSEMKLPRGSMLGHAATDGQGARLLGHRSRRSAGGPRPKGAVPLPSRTRGCHGSRMPGVTVCLVRT